MHQSVQCRTLHSGGPRGLLPRSGCSLHSSGEKNLRQLPFPARTMHSLSTAHRVGAQHCTPPCLARRLPSRLAAPYALSVPGVPYRARRHIAGNTGNLDVKCLECLPSSDVSYVSTWQSTASRQTKGMLPATVNDVPLLELIKEARTDEDSDSTHTVVRHQHDLPSERVGGARQNERHNEKEHVKKQKIGT
eukprot:208831-Rhodomonas_salina.12